MLRKIFGNNWRTTLAGVVQATALGFVGYKLNSPELVMAAAAALGQGVLAKDAGQSGTEK